MRRKPRRCGWIWALSGMLVGPVSAADVIDSLRWEEQRGETALIIQVDGNPEFRSEILDSGNTFRIEFPGTGIDPNAMALPGQGRFDGVTPSLSSNGIGTVLDVRVAEPSRYEITPSFAGYRVTAVAGAPSQVPEAMAQTGMQTPESDPPNVLEEIRYSPLSGGRVQIELKMARPPVEPGRFVTNDPPRIALDFVDTVSALDQGVISVGSGAVESIAAVQADDLTRLVINLTRTATYQTQILPDGIGIVVTGLEPIGAAGRLAEYERTPAQSEHQVTRVDFRRTREGGGKVTVELSGPDVAVDMREDGGEILIDFMNTGVAAELERRLDVVDFATPVQFIDTFAQGPHTRMVVSPVGRYTQAAYQAGNVFNLDILPLVETDQEQEADEFGYSGERLSLNFQKINVRAALNVIADFTGINFVTSDSVRGNLSLRLQDVPWDQALDIILQVKGLGMRQKGNVIWVAPATEIAAKERQALEARQQVSDLEPLVSDIIQVNYAKAQDIARILKSIRAVETGLDPDRFGTVSISRVETESNSLLSPRGNVTVDKRTNSILIQDTASKIREVRELIAKLDRPVRQVLIETRIVEAQEAFARNLGARFGYQTFTEDAQLFGSTTEIGDVATSGTLEGANEPFDGDGDLFEVTGDGLAVDLPASAIQDRSPGSYAFQLVKIGAGYTNLINLELTALEAEGEGKIIASPKVLTSDQQKATIKQGQEVILDRVAFDPSRTAVTKEAVLELSVTPRITPDDRISMDVLVKQENFVTLDLLDKKEVRTQVLLDNGETVVIGGIYQQEDENIVTKIPILGDIPVLGAIFRVKEVERQRRELLVFLTPRIVNPALTVN